MNDHQPSMLLKSIESPPNCHFLIQLGTTPIQAETSAKCMETSFALKIGKILQNPSIFLMKSQIQLRMMPPMATIVFPY